MTPAVLIIDQGTPGEVVELDPIDEICWQHAAKVAGVFSASYHSLANGQARPIRFFSASFSDLLTAGYDQIIDQVLDQVDAIAVEIHAWSTPESDVTERVAKQILNRRQTEKTAWPIITSPGHQTWRVRFPGTMRPGISVTCLQEDGRELGGTLNGLWPSDALVPQSSFPVACCGDALAMRGTSAAVGHIAALVMFMQEQVRHAPPVLTDGFAKISLAFLMARDEERHIRMEAEARVPLNAYFYADSSSSRSFTVLRTAPRNEPSSEEVVAL